jgi:hypothetical protein
VGYPNAAQGYFDVDKDYPSSLFHNNEFWNLSGLKQQVKERGRDERIAVVVYNW